MNIFFLPINISKTLITTSAQFLISFFLYSGDIEFVLPLPFIYLSNLLFYLSLLSFLSVSPSFLFVSAFFLSVSTFFFICLYLLFYLSLPPFISISTFFFIYLSHLLYLKNNLSFLQPWFVSSFLTIMGFKWTFDMIKKWRKKCCENYVFPLTIISGKWIWKPNLVVR